MSPIQTAEDMQRRQHDIIVAAKENDLDGVKAAVQVDPYSVNHQDPTYGYTAVHVAAARRLESILDYLLTCEHIDLSLRDKSGSTAIDSAIGCGWPHLADRMYRVAYPKVMGGDDDADPFPPKETRGPKPVP